MDPILKSLAEIELTEASLDWARNIHVTKAWFEDHTTKEVDFLVDSRLIHEVFNQEVLESVKCFEFVAGGFICNIEVEVSGLVKPDRKNRNNAYCGWDKPKYTFTVNQA